MLFFRTPKLPSQHLALASKFAATHYNRNPNSIRFARTPTPPPFWWVRKALNKVDTIHLSPQPRHGLGKGIVEHYPRGEWGFLESD
jgi:hypothetical protein